MKLRSDPTSLANAASQLGAIIALGLVPAVLVTVFTLAPTEPAFDFRAFWQAGRDVAEGVSPYPRPDEIGSAAVQEFVYPPPFALLMLPFGMLEFDAAAAVFTVVLVAATALTIRTFEIRDWRCYGAAFASILVLGALRLGALTPVLALGLALAWRHRDRKLALAALVAFLVVAKLFLWPILVWTACTGRRAATALAVVFGGSATLAAWAVIGFQQIADYPHLLHVVAEAQFAKSYSPAALAAALGLSDRVALFVPFLLAPLGIATIVLASRRENGDAAAFMTGIAVALLLSPLVWLHYFALLLVLLAISQRQLTWLWLVPLAYWVVPFQESRGEAWRIAVGLGLAITIAIVAIERRARADALAQPSVEPAA